MVHSLEEISEQLAELQERLRNEDINSLVGGGVGLDLLGLKYIKDFQPRTHEDVDLYIDISQRGRLMSLLKGMGIKIDPSSHKNPIHLIAYVNGITYDFFSVSGNEKYGFFIENASPLRALVGRQVCSLHDYTPIRFHTDIATYSENNYYVLDCLSEHNLLFNLRIFLIILFA